MTVTTTQTPNTALRWPRGSVGKAQITSIVKTDCIIATGSTSGMKADSSNNVCR